MSKHNTKLTQHELDLENLALAGMDAPASGARKKELREIAQATLDERKKPVNIRMDTADLIALRQRAEESGLGYQTFMASVLHRFVTGGLVDRVVVDEIRTTFSKIFREANSPVPQGLQPTKKKLAVSTQKKKSRKQHSR